MAATILTTPAGDAMPLAINPPPCTGGTLLALDLGTTTGWALRTGDGAIASGTVSFRPSRYDGGGIRYLRFRGWLDQLATDVDGLSAVHFEEVRRHAGTDAAHIYGGLLATLTAWCEQHGIAYQGVPGRHDQALRHRQGQRRQGRGHRGDPGTRVQPGRRQRGRRARHPAVGHRDPRGSAMTRARPPNRRAAATVDLEHAGTRFTVTVGFYPDGRTGEVFTHGSAPARGSTRSSPTPAWWYHAHPVRRRAASSPTAWVGRER